MADTQVKITGTDFVVIQLEGEKRALIAATDKAEKFVMRYSEGNHWRTLFGLTLYARTSADWSRVRDLMWENNFVWVHAHV